MAWARREGGLERRLATFVGDARMSQVMQRPRTASSANKGRPTFAGSLFAWIRRWILTIALGVSLTLAGILVLFAITAIRFGSARAAVAYFKGYSPCLVAAPLRLGEVKPGARVPALLRVKNVSRKQVTILGGTASCGCVLIEQLPTEVEPGEHRDLRITVRVPSKHGRRFAYSMLFYLDAPGPPLVANVSGAVKRSED